MLRRCQHPDLESRSLHSRGGRPHDLQCDHFAIQGRSFPMDFCGSRLRHAAWKLEHDLQKKIGAIFHRGTVQRGSPMITLRKTLSNQKGLTIVEILVATAIIGVGLFSFISGYIALKNISQKTSVSSTFDKQINEISSNIKAGIENYQVNFNYKDSTEQEMLPIDKLPMAWDLNMISTKEK